MIDTNDTSLSMKIFQWCEKMLAKKQDPLLIPILQMLIAWVPQISAEQLVAVLEQIDPQQALPTQVELERVFTNLQKKNFTVESKQN